jgi:hypothetical protein
MSSLIALPMAALLITTPLTAPRQDLFRAVLALRREKGPRAEEQTPVIRAAPVMEKTLHRETAE